ncbi:hypothetical protein QBC35DRAFT_259081 [Podospora australis]|uniref:Uncharacterized protein n=1 Tax=Podospora australis TaxID=1536484 RepID=A0AAN6X4K1_9PEZI|nr:hypothetical protein QBC35DRAFT_259081 [Podospora australis]
MPLVLKATRLCLTVDTRTQSWRHLHVCTRSGVLIVVVLIWRKFGRLAMSRARTRDPPSPVNVARDSSRRHAVTPSILALTSSLSPVDIFLSSSQPGTHLLPNFGFPCCHHHQPSTFFHLRFFFSLEKLTDISNFTFQYGSYLCEPPLFLFSYHHSPPACQSSFRSIPLDLARSAFFWVPSPRYLGSPKCVRLRKGVSINHCVPAFIRFSSNPVVRKRLRPTRKWNCPPPFFPFPKSTPPCACRITTMPQAALRPTYLQSVERWLWLLPWLDALDSSLIPFFFSPSFFSVGGALAKLKAIRWAKGGKQNTDKHTPKRGATSQPSPLVPPSTQQKKKATYPILPPNGPLRT